MKKCILLMSILVSTTTFSNVNTIQTNLIKNSPNIKIENIQATEMKGIYSGSLNGQIVYLNDDAQHLISGSMIRLKDQSDLTKNLLVKQNSIEWKSLPFKDAIKVVKGNGQRQIAVFTDPNCPYCKKLDIELKKLDNITIYTFIFAIKPQSVEASEKVYCDPNPAQAWDNLIHKGIQSNSKSCTTPIENNKNLAKNLGISGTPTIILSNGLKISGAYPAEQIEQFFKEFGL